MSLFGKKYREIPIFFASDNNYAPYLAVAIKSLLKNASQDYFYKIHILTTNLDETLCNKLKKLETSYSSIEIISLAGEIEHIKNRFHLRDYYSIETYYRFFIADLFPQYDKVLYLDCDIIILGDISDLYFTNVSSVTYVDYSNRKWMDKINSDYLIFDNLMKQNNFNKNEYDILVDKEEIIIKNPEYDENDFTCTMKGISEFINTGDFKEVINIDDVINLKLVGAMEHLEDKILNGRIKNPETEKIKLEYYKIYLKTIKTYIDLQNKPLKADNIEKTKLGVFLDGEK